MCEVEGDLEKKRRELAIRSDFNICDTYKMFIRLASDKKGIDCDDLFDTVVNNLGLELTRDEMFMIFFAVDADGDGLWNQAELIKCFTPREEHYSFILN